MTEQQQSAPPAQHDPPPKTTLSSEDQHNSYLEGSMTDLNLDKTSPGHAPPTKPDTSPSKYSEAHNHTPLPLNTMDLPPLPASASGSSPRDTEPGTVGGWPRGGDYTSNLDLYTDADGRLLEDLGEKTEHQELDDSPQNRIAYEEARKVRLIREFDQTSSTDASKPMNRLYFLEEPSSANGTSVIYWFGMLIVVTASDRTWDVHRRLKEKEDFRSVMHDIVHLGLGDRVEQVPASASVAPSSTIVADNLEEERNRTAATLRSRYARKTYHDDRVRSRLRRFSLGPDDVKPTHYPTIRIPKPRGGPKKRRSDDSHYHSSSPTKKRSNAGSDRAHSPTKNTNDNGTTSGGEGIDKDTLAELSKVMGIDLDLGEQVAMLRETQAAHERQKSMSKARVWWQD